MQSRGTCHRAIRALIARGWLTRVFACLSDDSGVPKPIEIHAHDPVRYVGDMLGWLHQAAASEFELITSLFRPETDDLFAAESSAEDSHHTAPQSPRALSTADSSMVADATANSDSLKLLSSIFAAVCRPFEVRLDEVLDTHPSLVVAFKLASLLDFYARTIGMLVDPKSPLPDNLLAYAIQPRNSLLCACECTELTRLSQMRRCKNKCMRAFYDVLRNASDHLNRSPLVAPADLSAPPMLTDSMTRLVCPRDSHPSHSIESNGVSLCLRAWLDRDHECVRCLACTGCRARSRVCSCAECHDRSAADGVHDQRHGAGRRG